MENLLRQGGLGDPTEPGFDTRGDVDISEFVLLIHGDLLTKERLDTVRDSRRIEDTPKDRFQYVVFIPGLFHYKMACVDALWRIYLQNKEGREDINSSFQHAGILRPRETGILTTKPGFRRMHDVVHHELRAAILECWRTEASSSGSTVTSLKEFANSKPEWDLIVKMSRDIVQKYVATTEGISKSRAKPEADRDQQHENQALRNRDFLLYVDLCNAMNSGDVGRVEASFIPWIYMFSSTGKHKYASQLARFVMNLHDVYPPDLSHIIRMNILCNPTGKPNAFRPVDWLVERNNLYTKVIYAGCGPNKNMDYICKQSPLIEVFRSCHVIVEKAFQLTHRTLKHAPPDMTATIERLRTHMQTSGLCEFRRGRAVEREITDNIARGLEVVHAKRVVLPVEEEAHEIEAADLEVH
ncbi:hypothetical protein EDB89DRAFT_1890233 [Lactarius sanguifluus]|nr:hypothetical protein EDB89DRAFT_1890233 [Lactarius sanguifluus]